MRNQTPQGIIPRKLAELCFAGFLGIFGLIMIYGTSELDTGWGSSGPEAGYFPYRIGLFILVVATAVFVLELMKSRTAQTIIQSRDAALNIVKFAMPLIALIAVVPRLGIYLAAVIYLMIAIGIIARMGLAKTIAISLLVPSAIFILFEFAFRTPLPKGPLSPLLGML